jgi:hypothetical protein
LGSAEQEEPHVKRKVLRLSETLSAIKDVNAQLATTTSRELVEDPLKSTEQSRQRWKIRSSYGDIGFKYTGDETIAYVASRMPAVFSACYRVLKEVCSLVIVWYTIVQSKRKGNFVKWAGENCGSWDFPVWLLRKW